MTKPVLRTGTSRGLVLTFEIEGDRQVSDGLDYIGEEIKDFRKPLQKVSKLLLTAWDKNFSSEGKELGEPWKGLSPKYAAWKAKRYPGKGILVRKGKMQGNFKSKVTPVSATLSNPTHYFRYHQSVGARTTNLPRRVMMKIDERRRKEIFAIFTEWIHEVASHFVQK